MADDKFISQITPLGSATTYKIKDSSAIVNITHSGTTFTATRHDGTTFEFNQQDNDTKNTAGSTDTSSKIFLIGAISQAANPQTYSHDTAYVGTDGCLYSGGTKVLTAHQDISGKLNTSLKGAANGLAELDANGLVPSSQLPSYVDDVVEYSALSSFPATGETGKIYVDTTTKKIYRWSGTTYVEISASLALGTTSSTAFRGDYGNSAYAHAVTKKGSEFASGLYKITTNSEGHVTAATAVVKADITALGIPGSDTTYTSKDAASGGTDLSLVTTGEKYTWNNKGTYSKPSGGIPKTDLASAVQTSLGKADSALQSHQTIKQDGITGATVNRFGTCSTDAGSASKTVSITTGTFALEAGARVSVKFTNANTASTPTLNVNSKGAKNIFHKGAQITTGNNKALLAGICDFIYDGTQWHLVGNYIDTDTTYTSKAAASGGTEVSLVTTGEKATWNAKTSNTGTVKTVSTGIGLVGGDITTTGTIKAKLKSETALTLESAATTTGTTDRVYPVVTDKSGFLAVDVPWQNTTYTFANGTNNFTVTPAGGSTQTVTITPSIAWNGITQSGANSLDEGTSDFTDNTELFSSYASNNGFADSAATGKVYRRDAIHMYNYIKTKLAVTNNNINLSRNTETTIATIGGTAIKIKLPASDNTDAKVKQSASTTDNWRKVLLHYKEDAASTTAVTDSTNQVYAAVNISAQPSTGTLKANNLYATRAFNNLITGSGTTASDGGSSDTNRYKPAKWTFNTGANAIDGDMYLIKIPVAGHDYGVFMSVDNGTTYYPVVCNGTGRVTTNYAVNTYLQVVFEPTGSAANIFPLAGSTSRTTVSNGVFRVINYYDSNSNDTGYYHRKIYPNIKAGANQIFPYTLIMQNSDGRWESIVTSASTGTSKAKNTHGFVLSQVWCMYANATYSENTAVATYNIWTAHSNLIDTRYSFNVTTSSGMTGYKPVYLVGTIGSDGLFYLDDSWWSQTLPTTDDGKVYVYIGDAYDAYRLSLSEVNTAYFFRDRLQQYASGRGVKGISRSGTTFTVTRDDGTTFTFEQQDNNSVTGVKGNSETSYRTGNVNITAANIGLGNVENTKLSTWAGSSNITTIGTLSSGTVPWARLSNVPTASTSAAGIIQIGTSSTNAAAGNHVHGNLTNDGKITSTTTIANGDKLVIVDSDTTAASKITGSSITFDGSTTTKALTQKGTWETFNNYTHPSGTAANAAAVKVGSDSLGHVIIGATLTKSDIGLGNVENTKLSTWTGTTNITTIGILSNGLEIKGQIAGSTSTTDGHGLQSGGAYHNAYNNIILHGDASTGSSGIAFISDKVTASDGTITNINAPSDRAFIQYHACGVTTYTAENSAPTLATSGEAGRFVIGVGNDSGDKILLQAPGHTDVMHQMGTAQAVIPDTNNTTGTVGSGTQPVWVEGGIIKNTTYTLGKSVPNDAVFTDTKVTQTNITATTSADYRILLSGQANDTTATEGANKNTNLRFNTGTQVLSIGGSISATGDLTVTGNADLNGETYADSITTGSLLVNGATSFVQIPTAPTPAATSNDTSVATTAFVMNAFTANDAMVFKGVIAGSSSSPGGFTVAANRGDTYKVSTAGYVNGVKVEIGDMFICITDNTAAATSSNYSTIQNNWVVIQTNIDGAVIGPASATDGKVALFNGTTGKLIKQGTISTETVIKTVTLTGGAAPTLGTAFSVPNVTGNTNVTASKVTKSDNTVVKTISQAASTSSVIGSVTDGVLTFTQAITAVGAVTAGSTATASEVTITDVSASKVTLGTAFSIPNVTSVGSSASLNTTTQTVVTGIS